MSSTVAVAIALCAVSALAEGLLAGRDVKGRFAALRLPRYSPPLWAWGLIGLLYYAVCFVVLHHVLGEPVQGPRWFVTLGSVLVMMAVNAGRNYVFFRARDLRASFIVNVAYNLLAVVVFVLLASSARSIAAVFLPYLLYLTYATGWMHQLWRANQGKGEAGEQPVSGLLCQGESDVSSRARSSSTTVR